MEKLRAGDSVRRKDVNRDWGWNSDCKRCGVKPYEVFTVSRLKDTDSVKLVELGGYYYNQRFFEKVKEENEVDKIRKNSKVQISNNSPSKYRGLVGVVVDIYSEYWKPSNHTHYTIELVVGDKTIKSKIVARNVSLFKEPEKPEVETLTFKVGDKVTLVKGSRYEENDKYTNPKHGVVGTVAAIGQYSGSIKVTWPNGNNNYAISDLEFVEVTPERKYLTISLGDASKSGFKTYEEALERVKNLQLASPHKEFALVEVLETAELVVTPTVVKMNKVK